MEKIEKRKCPNCNEENFTTDIYCKNCKTRLNYESLTEENKKRYIKIEGEGFTTATKIIAWIELVCSVITSINFFSKASKVEYNAIENIPMIDSLKSTLQMTGVYFLVGGIIIFILLMTVHYISRNIINIAKNQ